MRLKFNVKTNLSHDLASDVRRSGRALSLATRLCATAACVHNLSPYP